MLRKGYFFMRFIHTADIHLDSALSSNFDTVKGQERNYEILNSFRRMIEYASANNIEYVLICGDLFDTDFVSPVTAEIVEGLISNNSHITFFYLKGNHDSNGFFSRSKVPSNLCLFNDNWISYDINDSIKVWGTENLDNQDELPVFDAAFINIVMLHGQKTDYDMADSININKFKNKNVNYMALGHVHEPSINNLDSNNSFYCYSGCLEGRGFDETGKRGFIVTNIDEITGLINPEFIPFATRTVQNICVDISDCETMSDVANKCRDSLETVANKDVVKLALTGKIPVTLKVDCQYLTTAFSDNFYYLKVKDETLTSIAYDEYAYDKSLKGEYACLVLNSELTDEEKGEILRLGIDAIMGGR